MMNRHFIFALCAVLGFSVSGVSMAQSTPADKEAAAKAAKAAKVKFRWGKSLKSAQKQAEETAQEIDAEHKERQSPFRFSMCNIQPGEEIEYCNNPEIKCTVVDDKTVSYQGQSYSLSSLAQLLTGSKYSVAGPRYFKYKGEWLNDIRHRLEG